MSAGGGFLWGVIDVIGVAVLAAALMYGILKWRNRSRSPAIEAARDRATERVYQEQK